PVLQGGGRDASEPDPGAARAAGQVRGDLRRRRRAPAFAEVEHVLRRREGLLGPDGVLARGILWERGKPRPLAPSSCEGREGWERAKAEARGFRRSCERRKRVRYGGRLVAHPPPD